MPIKRVIAEQVITATLVTLAAEAIYLLRDEGRRWLRRHRRKKSIEEDSK